MSPLILVALGFIIFFIGMIGFNSSRLKKINSFPYSGNKTPRVSIGGFSYFIFLKFDKIITSWAIFAWTGLILFVIGSLLNAKIL